MRRSKKRRFRYNPSSYTIRVNIDGGKAVISYDLFTAEHDEMSEAMKIGSDIQRAATASFKRHSKNPATRK